MIKLCLRAVALLVLGGAIASCGGAAGPPKAPADEAVTTPERALAALDLAEANLSRALGGGGAQAGYGQAPAASAAPMTPPPPPPPTSPGLAQARVADAKVPGQPAAELPQPRPAQPSAGRLEREAPRAPSDPCSTACSALASMERAADHLCGLAGSADNRCTSARERVKNASARVHAACPACAR